MEDFRIIPMVPDHWPLVRAIYDNGIATGHATFQTQTPDWQQWDDSHAKSCRLVILEDGKVKGWAALAPGLSPKSICRSSGSQHLSGYFSSKQGLGQKITRNPGGRKRKQGILDPSGQYFSGKYCQSPHS